MRNYRYTYIDDMTSRSENKLRLYKIRSSNKYNEKKIQIQKTPKNEETQVLDPIQKNL